MSENVYIFCVIMVMALGTAFLRFAPFLIFRNKTPEIIAYLGRVLPEAVIAMLIVYCLKNISFVSGSRGLPEIIALAVVTGLHKWLHNTLISILAGTLSYMFLVQFVFA